MLFEQHGKWSAHERQKVGFIMMGVRSAIVVTVLVACLSGPALAQSIDQSFYYKLSTQFRGSGMKLDVFNGGPKNNMTRLEPDQDVSGQFWRFAGNPDGRARVWTSSTEAQTTISHTSLGAPTSPVSSGASC